MRGIEKRDKEKRDKEKRDKEIRDKGQGTRDSMREKRRMSYL